MSPDSQAHHADQRGRDAHDRAAREHEARHAQQAHRVMLHHLPDGADAQAGADLLVDRGAQRRHHHDHRVDKRREDPYERHQGADERQRLGDRDDHAGDDAPHEHHHKAAPSALDAGAHVDATLLGGGVDVPRREARPLERIAQDAECTDDGHEKGNCHEQHRLHPAAVTREQRPRAGEVAVAAESLELVVRNHESPFLRLA